jgi:DNA-binding CsgD family transcriptional regulator
MDHLLIIAASQTIPENVVQSLRLAGWRITMTADVVAAKQLLQRGDIAGVLVDLNTTHDPERLKILRFMHEFCPKTLVIMLQSAAHIVGKNLVYALDAFDGARKESQNRVFPELCRLSPAQKRIAELVAQAYPNREIARKLKIKEQSVRNELSRIFKKLGVWNRVELALLVGNKKDISTEAFKHPWKTDFDHVPQSADEVTAAL